MSLIFWYSSNLFFWLQLSNFIVCKCLKIAYRVSISVSLLLASFAFVGIVISEGAPLASSIYLLFNGVKLKL